MLMLSICRIFDLSVFRFGGIGFYVQELLIGPRIIAAGRERVSGMTL
jgi:hypothetical protein